MRPIKLKIKGLNSFVEEQTIDFEKLTKQGFLEFWSYGKWEIHNFRWNDSCTLRNEGNVTGNE
ncbi:MAG: hypothetical protein ACLTCI_00460 [[Clostridium] nexile]